MNNKKGVKLLAAVMAFAMVFVAGFVVLNNNDEADAITSTAVYEMDEPSSSTGIITIDNPASSKEYVVKENSKVSFTGTPAGSPSDIKFYVLSGKTLEVTSAIASNLKVTVYVVTQAPATNGGAIAQKYIANVDASFTGAKTFTFTGSATAGATDGVNGDGLIQVTGDSGVNTTNITSANWTIKVYDNAATAMIVCSVNAIPSNIGYVENHTAAGTIVFNANIPGITTTITNTYTDPSTGVKTENQIKLDEVKITTASTSLTVDLAATGGIKLTAGASAGAEIEEGTLEISKGTVTVDSTNGMKFTVDHFIGVAQSEIGNEMTTDVTSGLVLDSNKKMANSAYVYGVAIADTEVKVASTKVLSFQQGSSFNGKVYGLKADGTHIGVIDLAVSGDNSQRYVTLTVGNDTGVITVTDAKTLKTLTSGTGNTYAVGSEFIIKSITESGITIGDSTDGNGSSFELADSFTMTPSSTSDWSLGGDYWTIFVQKDSTINLMKNANATTAGYAKITAGSHGTVYIFGDVNIAKVGSNTITASKIYYTKVNEVSVKAAGTANEELATVTNVENNAFYVLSETQAIGYDITNATITFKSGAAGTTAFSVFTTTDGTNNASKIVKDINISGFKGTINAKNSSDADIPAIINVCAGTTFTISNETVLRTSTQGISLDLKQGSELVIKDSNILMEVTKDAKADVKVSAKTMELTNPSGSIEVGYMREAIVSGDINGSIVTVYGNMTIAGTAKISSGSTMNVYKGGNLNVEGALTVEGRVNFNTNSTGTISGTMTIGMPNAGAVVDVNASDVTVTETGTVKVVAPNAKGISEGRTNTLSITNSVTPVYNGVIGAVTTPSPDGKLDNTPYMFTVLGTFEMNGTLAADNIYDKGTVTINGTMGSTSTITIFDGVSITLTSVTGTLNVVDTNIMAEAERPQAKLSSGNSITVQNVKGVTVSEAVSSKTYTSSGTNYRVYVSDMTVAGTFSAAIDGTRGSISLAGTPTAYYGESIYGKILISDDVIIGKNVTLASTANVEMSGTITVIADAAELDLNGGMMNVTGTITVKTGGTQTAREVDSTSESYISAAKSYVLDAATAVYTYTYTTFENAIATVLSAENKTVEVLGYVTVSKSTDIPADSIVIIEKTLTIGKDADVVAKQKSNVSGDKISVSGSFTAEDYINDLAVDEVVADVVSTKDAARTWTSLAKALEGAGEGSVITASTDMTLGSVTIPAGVTVNTEYNITVKKNSVITVDGTLNVTKGTITQNSASAPDVKGSIVLGEKGVVAVVDAKPDIYADVAGAHFQKLVGAKDYYFVTNVAYAAANADAKVVGGNIDIYGEVAMGDVTFTKAADADSLTVRLIKTTDADLKTAVSGNVKLANGAAFIAGDNVFFTGSVAVDEIATIAFQKAEGISIAKYTDNAASTPVEYALINTTSAKGAMTFQSGTATIGTGALAIGAIVTSADFVVTVGKDATLVVPQNGTVTAGAITKAETASFVVEGTLDVVKGKVTVNGTMDVLGTVNISQTTATNGVQVAGILNVLGTVNVSKESTKDGTLKVTGVIAVGSKPTDLGAAGTVNGIITTGSTDGYVKVYSGSVETVKVNGLDAEPTVININGKVYMTLLGNGDVQTILESEKIELDGVEKYTSDVKIYSDEAMTKEINSFNIGDYETVYFELDTAKADVYISVGNYITLWIDGERYNTSSNYPVKITVGTHDIKVLIDPNYEGTTTITFNGQTITNGKLVITTDMVGEKNVLSAVGDVKYVPTETPTEEPGMGITDYLLIVLVILAAILVVVVAIRMMRS